MTLFNKKTRLLLLVIIFYMAQLAILIPQTNVVKAADNGLAQKPFMGWSSYSMQVYSNAGSTWISAAQIKAQSDAMHTKLQAHGYNAIHIDAAWNGGMDGYGRPIPSTTLYPNGFQEVIDYVHNNGQTIGIYGIPGLSPQAYNDDLPIYGAPGCTMQDIAAQPLVTGDYWGIGYKMDFSNPCAQKYINSIADLYGEWGIDFLKFDSVTPGSGHNDTSIDSRDDVKAWSQALAPHHIWFELSWALDHNYVDFWKKYANGWRVDWDVESYKPGVSLTEWSSISRLFPIAALWWRDAGPGGWNDFDSLNVGNGAMDGLTQDERQTAMSLWSMSSAQLYTGNDLTNLDSFGIQLLTNDEVIAVNQAGKPAHPLSMETDQQVWYANNGDGSYTVGLYNLGSSAATVSVNWQDIGLNGAASVRDLWSHTNLGTFNSGFSSVNLASHASRLFKVVSTGGANTLNNDDTGIKYTGDWTRSSGRAPAGSTQDLAITVSDSLAQNSTISPSTGSFDKKTAVQADVTTTMTLSGNTLSSIANNGASLVAGTDYTVSGNQVTIKKEYLAARQLGTVSLKFTFSAGNPQTLTITVSDSSLQNSKVSPSAVSFDQKAGAQADVALTLALNGNTLESINNGTTNLIAGTDYTISGTVVTLKKEYLAGLATGTTNMTFSFNAGAAQTVALIVRNSAIGGSISLNDDNASITYTGTWNHSTGRGVGDYQNDVHWTETNNDSFEYAFTGTGIEMITELDPSQGAMDIYVDNVLKQTISTNNIGRLAQQTVYSITGLSAGSHTFKAVKKSGFFMLLDKIRVITADLITPSTASFDKKPANQADITTTMTVYGSVYGNSLSGITNGGATLISGTDYTVASDLVTVKKAYLAAQPLGINNLDFSFSGGANQTLIVTISDSDTQLSTVSVNDNDPGITYSGSWGHSTGRGLGDYLDDVHYTEANDAYFEYAFSGTGIDLITEKDSSQGDVDIYVDNVFKQTVSTYNDSRLIQQTVYSISGLSNGAHTIKAVKKSGGYMLLDKFNVSAPIVISTPKVSINDNDPGITYSGSWGQSTGRGLGDYLDDVHYTETNDAYFEYAFTGTGFDLITEKDSNQGDVDVYVDNVLKQTVSTFNASRLVQQTVYSVSGLSDGSHTVKAVKKSGTYMLLDKLNIIATVAISPTSRSFDKKVSAQADVSTTMTLNGNTLSSITNSGTPLVLNTDYTVSGNEVTIKKAYLAGKSVGTTNLILTFSGGGTLTFAVAISDSTEPVNPTVPAAGASYSLNNDDSRIAYTGAWQRSSNRGLGDYRNDVQFTEANDAYFEYAFSGTGIELVTEKDVSQGDMDIYVDNVFKQTVSAYSPNRLVQYTVYSITGLSDGAHTLKAVKKSGSYMLLDKLKVIVADLIGPATGSFDKGSAVKTDVTTTILQSATLLTRIVNGDTALVLGTDYTVSGSTITIKKGYLAAQPVGTTKLTFSFSGDYQDDVHLTTANNDYYEYSFKGTGIQVITEKASNLGNIDIYVDGVFKQTINTFNSTRLVQQTVYSLAGLSNTVHTIKVVKKSGAYMLADKLSFTSSLAPLPNKDAVDADKATLAIGYTIPDSSSSVTHNLSLPLTGGNGTTISWSSDKISTISDSGIVTRPTFTKGDKSVVLTAKINKGNAKETKKFTVTVTKLAQSNAEAVAADKDLLAIGYINPDKANSVTKNITLPLVGSNGTTISWSSNKPTTISNNGTVVRPVFESGNKDVTLTATITKGSSNETKKFNLTVKKLDKTHNHH
ncbi:hypothetical protein EHS13_21330 [Paenibacillus psychroresistens]|uniref:Alpha-galactosidase n=1 Tax=Paenibacillus psychroresistens TaxID=1778678 RepID=A0A6B8RPE7_9BACL|nr:X2-like carbohydrate binding domain-containing protein [Paenibacillus psychroresistens]QGQ97246.1 hypothetical protein EHS13_21330 [Paenibacillus psychroresistens]